MQLSLHTRCRGTLFLTGVTILAVCSVGETLRLALIETWGESSDLKNLERARALDPLNAEVYYRIGTLYLLGTNGDSSDPLPLLRKATELNPKLGKYWLALGRACFVARNQACAAQAMDRAVRLSPMTPSTEWEAATYYALTGRSDNSFAHFKHLLQFDPEKEDDIFRFTVRVFSPNVTWQNVIATLPDTRVKCDYIAFLAENRRFDLAEDYWTQTAATFPAPSFESVKSYLQKLVQAEQYGKAANVWKDLLRLGVIGRADVHDQNNLVFNGSFEQAVLNAGFDWQILPGNFVAINFSDPSAYSGKYALRIDYTVPHNSEGDAAYQIIPVARNQKYVLTAYSRSEDLTSDSGPRLRVQDAQCSACLDIMTDATVGTTPWHQLRLAFSTGPKTQAVRLSVWRSRARTFPMDINGSFWLDSVSLNPDGSNLPNDASAAKVAIGNLP